MLKYIVGVLVLISGVLLWMVWGIGVPEIYYEELKGQATPHLSGDPSRSLEYIHVYALYFVPKNKTENRIENWYSLLEEHLQQLADFHSLQFQNQSQITYTIYPEAVAGLEESPVYDTDNTGQGNPRALVHIAEELEERMFKRGGDLFDESFVKRSENAHSVMGIFYEGVGASGGVIYESELETSREIAQELGLAESTIFILDIEGVDGFFLLNKDYLTGKVGPFGTSFLAHEFYHTLGISDQYIAPKATPTSQDIMGLGRLRPLEKTYLSRSTLKELGL